MQTHYISICHCPNVCCVFFVQLVRKKSNICIFLCVQLFSRHVQCEWTDAEGKPPSLAELHSEPPGHVLRGVSSLHPAGEALQVSP